MRHVIIGTAGHVDHGKTRLCRALTGTNTDRWEEEQRRGITLDLGFAQLVLPGGLTAGIVDVPGHERLIKNMLAGATGIDLVLMVVAADDGFMPQTQEHLDILQLLGIKRGIIVLTKCDMVDADWLEVVKVDTQERVAGTFLEGAPVACVSAVTGEGIDELKALIGQMVEQVGDLCKALPACLPVDRVFSVKGHGTVVTGSLVAGSVCVGDTLEAYPQGARVRVRELQNHGNTVDEAEVGMRVAMNLAGVECRELARGCTLAAPGSLSRSVRITCELQVLADAEFGIKNASQVHFYTGTQECVARVRLLDAAELVPGERGYAQFLFENELAARAGDHFVVRFFSPVVTLGGGEILDMSSKKLKRMRAEVLARLNELAGTPERRCAQLLCDAGLTLPTQEALLASSRLSPAELDATLEQLVHEGVVVQLGSGLAATEALDCLGEQIRELIGEYHKAHPLDVGIRLGELRERLGGMVQRSALVGRSGASWFAGSKTGGAQLAKTVEALISYLSSVGCLSVTNDRATAPGFEVVLTPEQEQMCQQVLGFYRQRGFEVPTRQEAAAAFASQTQLFDQVVSYLQSSGELINLNPDTLCLASVCEQARDLFCSMFESAQSVTLASFRDKAGVSRKYAVLFLDYFDRMHISQLVDDARVLLRNRSPAEVL